MGRGPSVQLQLDDSTVSAEHATIYFDGGAWKLRDLGSRNGTYLNGNRIDLRTAHLLAEGDELAFGGARQAAWYLDSLRPPGPTARTTLDEVIAGEAGVLWLPRASEPEACVRSQDGRWLLESAEESRMLADGDTVTLAGETYRLELPAGADSAPQRTETTLDAARSADLELRFVTSRDREHITVEATWAGKQFPLGARAHNLPLLCLAQRRLAERQSGITESECGWFYSDELRDAVQLDRVALNLQLWRATQAMGKLGLPAERLIERRPDTEQLRIGFAALAVGEA